MSQGASVMEPLDYAGHVERLRSADVAVAAEVAGFHGIEAVLQWMQRRGLLHKDGIDMVGQDEFSYDFLLKLDMAGRWLAFGVS